MIMKINLTFEEVNCGLGEFYKNVGKHLMDDIMGYVFDCRHIEVSKKIQDIFFEYYKEKYNVEEWEVCMLLAMSGPKVNHDLTNFEIEVDDQFMKVADYTDVGVSDEVKNHVRKYFEEYLPQYTVYEVYHKSNHDDDGYLYMVEAYHKENCDNFAVWTSWNESTQSLNHGHYKLTKEQAKKVLKENFFDCTGSLMRA